MPRRDFECAKITLRILCEFFIPPADLPLAWRDRFWLGEGRFRIALGAGMGAVGAIMNRAAKSPPHLATLVLLTSVSILTLNMFLPSLPGIAASFETDYATVSLSVSGYLAITAVLQIILGPLSDRYGRRPVLLISMVFYLFASLGCAMATSIGWFLAFRVLQSAVIAGSALSAAIIRDTTEEREAANLLGYVGMAMAVAPMLAPMVGGVLDAGFGWRANFWFYSALGLLLLALVWVDLGETNPAPAETFADQLRAYPELLRSRRFWAYSLCMSFGIGGFYVFVSGAPFVAAEIFRVSPALLGLGLGSITSGFFLGSFLSGRYSARMGLLWMVMAGRVVAFAGLAAGLGLYAVGLFHPLVFFAAAICTGIGNGLTTPSARVGSLSVRPHLAGSASGLSGALIVAVGAVLTVLPGLLLTSQNGVWVLMALMMALAAGGLASGLYVWVLDRREGK